MAGAEGQADVDTTKLFGKLTVLVLRIDDKYLDAQAYRPQRDRRKEVRLAGT